MMAMIKSSLELDDCEFHSWESKRSKNPNHDQAFANEVCGLWLLVYFWLKTKESPTDFRSQNYKFSEKNQVFIKPAFGLGSRAKKVPTKPVLPIIVTQAQKNLEHVASNFPTRILRQSCLNKHGMTTLGHGKTFWTILRNHGFQPICCQQMNYLR